MRDGFALVEAPLFDQICTDLCNGGFGIDRYFLISAGLLWSCLLPIRGRVCGFGFCAFSHEVPCPFTKLLQVLFELAHSDESLGSPCR